MRVEEWTVLVLALLCQGVGEAMQKHGVASRLRSAFPTELRSQWRAAGAGILSSGIWLSGVSIGLVGAALGIQAIAMVDLVTAVPILNAQVLVTALIGVLVLGERLSLLEWLGLGAVVLAAWSLGESTGQAAANPVSGWGLLGVLVGATILCGLTLLVAEKSARRSALESAYGIAAGCAIGAGNVILKGITADVRASVGHFSIADGATLQALVLHPFFLPFVAAMSAGFVFLQSGYAAGRLSVVIPIKTTASIGFSVALAVGLFGERLTPERLAGVALVGAGTVLLIARGLREGHGAARTRSPTELIQTEQ